MTFWDACKLWLARSAVEVGLSVVFLLVVTMALIVAARLKRK